MKTYLINEIFYSLQGEGLRAGSPSIFVRFAGCNMRCSLEPGPKSIGGFDCDTEYMSGRKLTLGEVRDEVEAIAGGCRWIIFTGGEPGLQLDTDIIEHMKARGFRTAVETNGTIELPPGLDWITVSPKAAEHAMKQLTATELKYVRAYGQGIPRPKVKAEHYLVSPAATPEGVSLEALRWCIRLVKENPTWRLSVQQHKAWQIR